MASATAEAAPMGVNRREFLYYIWGASIALVTAEFAGLLIWFAIPRFREGEFGGKFGVSTSELPELNSPPSDNAKGRFWLVNLDTNDPNELMYEAAGDGGPVIGVAAIYKVCTHLGCIYAWNAPNNRFECPCHGSKYRLDGRRIEDPAPRTLDRFKIEALDSSGAVIAESELVNLEGREVYAPLVLPPETASINVDTGAKKEGAAEELLCEVLETGC